MRTPSGAAHGVALLCLSLSGCTTIGSGIAVTPPGIGTHVFRECLLDRGFYPSSAPSPDALLAQSSGAFVASATTIIANGLMPTLAYDPASKDSANSPYTIEPGHDWPLNRFLDCYIGPVSDDDGEGRLLRAHILLVLTAKFGAELVLSHSGSRQVAQAERLLGHVADAELALRSASRIMAAPSASGQFVVADPASAMQTNLRWRAYATRLLRVFQVGVDAERIDAQQSIDRAANLVAAFSGSTTDFSSVLRDGLAGVVAVQGIRLYGDAYLRDARETLAMTRRATTVDGGNIAYDVAAFRQGWKNWDDELAATCATLATVARKDDPGCLPR
jgi:hypothetical protein